MQQNNDEEKFAEQVVDGVSYYWHPEYGWCAKSFEEFAERYPIIGNNKEITKGDKMINLGDEVKDKVSGFTGITIAKHSYLEGCDRFSVQPKINKDGTHPDDIAFDAGQLEVIKASKVKRSEISIKDPGGPEKYTDKREY